MIKDSTARATIGEQAKKIEALEKEVYALTSAFNALFDFLADEVGFVAGEEMVCTSYNFYQRKKSPRRFAMTEVPQAEIVRTRRKLRRQAPSVRAK